MLGSMSWVSYCEWYHFYLLEPFGDIKDDWYTSQTLYAILRGAFPNAEINLNDHCRYTEIALPGQTRDEPISDEELKLKLRSMRG